MVTVMKIRVFFISTSHLKAKAPSMEIVKSVNLVRVLF